VLAFISDMGVVSSARAPGGPPLTQLTGASLDHAMWFHRPARADEWLLFDVEPVSNAGARGLARGSLHTVDGVLVASIVQEALLRGAERCRSPDRGPRPPGRGPRCQLRRASVRSVIGCHREGACETCPSSSDQRARNGS
jgi:acyl-CoA thioesterase-2